MPPWTATWIHLSFVYHRELFGGAPVQHAHPVHSGASAKVVDEQVFVLLSRNFSPGWPLTHYTAEDDLERLVLLLHPPKS